MEPKHFPLSSIESNKFVNIIRIVFGITCIIVAFYWLSFNMKSPESDGTLWVTIAFLTLFGVYLIWAGLGKAYRFIEIGSDYIKLKKSIFFPPLTIKAPDTERIEIYPLNLVFFFKTGKRNLLRFGTTFYETNEKIRDEIVEFSRTNNIRLDVIEEKL